MPARRRARERRAAVTRAAADSTVIVRDVSGAAPLASLQNAHQSTRCAPLWARGGSSARKHGCARGPRAVGEWGSSGAPRGARGLTEFRCSVPRVSRKSERRRAGAVVVARIQSRRDDAGVYTGCFAQDTVTGCGVCCRPDDTVDIGWFKDGALDGCDCRRIYFDGSVDEGVFAAGRFVRPSVTRGKRKR